MVLFQVNKPRNLTTKCAQAFSLLELLVVFAVMGVLLSFAVPFTNERICFSRFENAYANFIASVDATRTNAIINNADYLFSASLNQSKLIMTSAQAVAGGNCTNLSKSLESITTDVVVPGSSTFGGAIMCFKLDGSVKAQRNKWNFSTRCGGEPLRWEVTVNLYTGISSARKNIPPLAQWVDLK